MKTEEEKKGKANKSKTVTFGVGGGGASSREINHADASRLVGGIVEKGFSGPFQSSSVGPSSAPTPTVLPFPVARHRSHGPHWTPAGGGASGNDEAEEGEDGEDEEGSSGFDPIMAFAKPVQRKEKKGLDFTRWREIMAAGHRSVPHKQVGDKHSVESKKRNKVGQGLNKPSAVAADDDRHKHSSGSEVVRVQEQESSDMEIDIAQEKVEHDPLAETFVQKDGQLRSGISETTEEILMETGLESLKRENKMGVDTEMQYISRNNRTPGFGSYKLVNEHGDMSLERQIDTENRARLEKMSAGEIAEAQAEIMAKMSPALMNALKKRGLDKLRSKIRSGSDMAGDGEVGNLLDQNKLIKGSTLSDNGSSHKLIKKEDSEDTQKDLDNHSVPDLNLKSSSLWDSWSKRVENVRELRFSLDGNIIKSDFVQLPGTGFDSVQSGYSADNVSERDFLRTEGDPGAAGYTIKEAVTLTRSVVPGQRALALHLIAALLDKAIEGILQNKVGNTLRFAETARATDWEAIWAFALGPEPELALSMRICLDDNHNSIVLACAKVIQSALSCDANESFYNISEKIPYIQDDVPTATVFRSKPEIDAGFLHGGFWKYSAKSSNILPFADDVNDKPEGEHTIKDDVIVAGQDVAAGLVRMGTLSRIRYLLEMEPSVALEECLLSILIAIARHSPTCATAIMLCQRLVQTVVNRFTTNKYMEINPSKIKSVTLFKVLAQMDKKTCVEFIKNGIFRKVTWHLCRYSSLDQWINSGREACKLSSGLLVEQLRIWKVCIKYGYCVSDLEDLFPAWSIWLNLPSFEKLVDNNILSDFAAVSKEAYLLLEALTKRLPNFYSPMLESTDATAEETETWSWSNIGPLIDLALEWTMLTKISPLIRFFDRQSGDKRYNVLQDSTLSSLLWVVSSAMHMLSGVLEAVIPVDSVEFRSGRLPWLPEFVPKIGLNLIRNEYFEFSGVNNHNLMEVGSFLQGLCHLRHKCGQETSIATASCLQGMIQVTVFVDKLIQLAKPENNILSTQHLSFSREDKILAEGILHSSLNELGSLLRNHMKFASDWQPAQLIEMFGRGGPAPGDGVGWGASGGGFWSTSLLLAHVDARLITYMLEIFQNVSVENPLTVEQSHSSMERISTALKVCLIAGPRDRSIVDKLFDFLFQVPVLKCLDFGIHQYVHLNNGLQTIGWKYEEEDYMLFSSVLVSHFKSRWLSIKKAKAKGESQDVSQNVSKRSTALETIYEEIGSSNVDNKGAASLAQEWAHQRLPLPNHWFLSPISATYYRRNANLPSASTTENSEQEQAGFVEVAQAGLFLLLGFEAMRALVTFEFHSPISSVPVVWKVHALSVMLVDGMCVLENEKSRDVYESLQNVYGQLINESKLLDTGEIQQLKFQSDVHESYSTFIEMLVEQFAAISYGDLVFGRQIAIYLHRHVEVSVRLAAWSALSNARALELLPPLEKCFAEAEGYLEPMEEDAKILEAYVKSWVSGALDKAATRRSASYTLVVHHLASFVFGDCAGDLALRNQLVKSLLRDYSHKRHHEAMMMYLLQYKRPATCQPGVEDTSSLQISELEKRFQLFREACEGNTSLVNEVEKLEICMRKNCS